MAKLIALCGPQQVGKTTAAESLVKFHGFTRLAFADPLYSMVAALMGISVAEVRMLRKTTPLDALEGQTLRHTLQTLGTEWGRNLMGSAIWANATMRKARKLVDEGKDVIIDDCRFVNEYAALLAAGGKLVGLKRADLPEQVNEGHGSEVEWGDFETHAAVLNNNDLNLWKSRAGDSILAALEPSLVAG